jgi:phage terminase large subunit-like protein
MPVHPTTQYARDVVSGNITGVCLREWQACDRHLRDLRRVGSPDFPYVFDETRADRVFKWFGICRHVRGCFTGEPITLDPFQIFDNGCLFGWVHKDTGRRRFNKSLNLRARGNVKSTEMSGIANYGMCADVVYPPYHPELREYENMPEVECAAVDKGQAKRVWGDAKIMGEKSPDIAKRLNIKKTYIEHKTRGGWLRPLSKDTKNKDSGAPTIVIVDEYHAHPTSEIHDILFSSFGKRAQSLMCIISTAGEDAENNPCKVEYDIGCKILSGEVIADNYFVMIRELDVGDDPHDETTWVKANPILRSGNDYAQILYKEIKAEHDLAYGTGDPSKIREFLVKRMNLWQVDAENKYASGCMDKWKASARPRDEFYNIVRGRECFCGMDLSKAIDLTALGFVFPLEGGYWAVCAHGFMPQEGARRHELTDRVPYKSWAQDKWCTLTKGAVTDYDYIRQHIRDMEFEEEWIFREFDYDPFNATHLISQMQKELDENGLLKYTEEQFVEIRQGVLTLSEPTKFFRELILRDKIIHDGSPLLTWALSNAVEVTDNNGNIKLSKKTKTDSQRIDPLAAIIFAMARAIRFIEKPPFKSVYETRGIITI